MELRACTWVCDDHSLPLSISEAAVTALTVTRPAAVTSTASSVRLELLFQRHRSVQPTHLLLSGAPKAVEAYASGCAAVVSGADPVLPFKQLDEQSDWVSVGSFRCTAAAPSGSATGSSAETLFADITLPTGMLFLVVRFLGVAPAAKSLRLQVVHMSLLPGPPPPRHGDSGEMSPGTVATDWRERADVQVSSIDWKGAEAMMKDMNIDMTAEARASMQFVKQSMAAAAAMGRPAAPCTVTTPGIAAIAESAESLPRPATDNETLLGAPGLLRHVAQQIEDRLYARLCSRIELMEERIMRCLQGSARCRSPDETLD